MSEKSSLLQALQAQRAVLKLTIQLAFFVRRRLFKRSSATSLNFQVNRPLINWEYTRPLYYYYYSGLHNNKVLWLYVVGNKHGLE